MSVKLIPEYFIDGKPQRLDNLLFLIPTFDAWCKPFAVAWVPFPAGNHSPLKRCTNEFCIVRQTKQMQEKYYAGVFSKKHW